MVTVLMLLQYLKALSPMEVTESGIVMVPVRPEHSPKAAYPMEETLFPKVTLFRLVHS